MEILHSKFEEKIYRYRYAIGGFLILVILAGSGFLIWQKLDQNHQKESDKIEALNQQNEILRQQLASNNQQVAGATDTQESVGDKININTANLAELDKLTGIGPAIGQRIIDYRNEKGAFQTIEDLKNVKGIGDKTFEKLADSITVGN